MSGYVVSTPALAVFATLQAWLMDLTGLDLAHVIQGRQNSDSAPKESYIIMTQVAQKGLSTFDLSYNTSSDTETVNNSFDYVIQCDCYGTNAGDMATAIATMFDSEPGCDFFDAYTTSQGYLAMAPLYSDDPISMAFTNEENQYESRFLVKLHIEVNTGVTIPMQFVSEVSVTITNTSTTPR